MLKKIKNMDPQTILTVKAVVTIVVINGAAIALTYWADKKIRTALEATE